MEKDELKESIIKQIKMKDETEKGYGLIRAIMMIMI